MISVDPGESCFWAKWWNGRLESCGQWPCLDIGHEEMLVIETQVIIPKFTKNPASIITLAHTAGAVAAEFGFPFTPEHAPGWHPVKWVTPKSWKGNTQKPKTVAQWASYAINRLVLEALDPKELSIYTVVQARLPPTQRHDLADAIGIGLWELGRLPQPRTESPRRAARLDALQQTLKRQAS